MKTHIVYLFLLFCVLLNFSEVNAQNSKFKEERRIYLWDVTLSMKGYQGKTPDIYDEVVKALKTDINSIVDEETEIIVLPFQVSILEEWKVKATAAGKKSIIRKIESYNNNLVTNTNICLPLTDVMQKYINPDKRNVLLLLTDGQHTPTPAYPESCLIDLIRNWCRFATDNDTYAFYVMLTEFAQDKELIKVIEETCRISSVQGTDINFVELYPYTIGKYNIKDDQNVESFFSKVECKKDVTIPEGVKIRLLSEENNFFHVDTIVDLREDGFVFKIRQRYSYEELQEILPREENKNVKIHLSIANQQSYPLVSLLLDEIDFEYINKPEKTLKIYVQD